MSTKRKIESTTKSKSITSFFKPANGGQPAAKKRAVSGFAVPKFDKAKWVEGLSPENRELLKYDTLNQSPIDNLLTTLL